MAKRACYDMEVVDYVILLVDTSDGEMFRPSVTNDVEAVVAEIARDHHRIDSYIILYRDTDGIWDQIVTKGGKFVGFNHVGATTREEALEWAWGITKG